MAIGQNIRALSRISVCYNSKTLKYSQEMDTCFFRKEVARAETSKNKQKKRECDTNVQLTFNSFCRSDFLAYSA